MTTVRLGPQVKRLIGDLAVQLGESAEEALKNMPSGDCCEVRRAELSSIDDRPLSSHPVARVLLLTRERVKATGLFFGVGEAYAKWLGDEQQVRYFAPRIFIDDGGEVLGDVTWSEFYVLCSA